MLRRACEWYGRAYASSGRVCCPSGQVRVALPRFFPKVVTDHTIPGPEPCGCDQFGGRERKSPSCDDNGHMRRMIKLGDDVAREMAKLRRSVDSESQLQSTNLLALDSRRLAQSSTTSTYRTTWERWSIFPMWPMCSNCSTMMIGLQAPRMLLGANRSCSIRSTRAHVTMLSAQTGSAAPSSARGIALPRQTIGAFSASSPTRGCSRAHSPR